MECANIAAQPVGFAAGVAAAEERIATMYAKPHVRPVPVVAVENFLVEIGEEKYVYFIVFKTSKHGTSII